MTAQDLYRRLDAVGQKIGLRQAAIRLAIAGAIAGPLVEIDLRTLYLKDISLFGCTALGADVFKNLVGYIERGEIRPLVGATFPLRDIVEAQKAFASKRVMGKIVLRVKG